MQQFRKGLGKHGRPFLSVLRLKQRSIPRVSGGEPCCRSASH